MRNKFILFVIFIFIFHHKLAVATLITSESASLKIEGDKILTFTSRSIEGTKESFVPGTTREESLRLTISGRAADTDVVANIFSTSITGTEQVTEREDKISVLLRRGNTEAYFGDFTANFPGLEFSNINKVLSGARIKGDYGRWGFEAIVSTPKGESKQMKRYGDKTQGPYSLGNSPVVIDSENVYVNGVFQKRGDDYDIDYEAGTITFRKKIILDIEIIQVDYEWRETTYQHSTYALRLTGKPYENFDVGATYLDDSDSLNKARDTYNSMTDPVAPKSHQVFGIDGALNLGSIFMSKGEFAYSQRNLDLLSSHGTREVGKAFKMDTLSLLGPVSLSTKFKRVGPAFLAIGDANPKQDIWEYGGSLGYQPNDVFFTETLYGKEKYAQSGVKNDVSHLDSKVKFTPPDLPSFAYFLNEDEESNDPVSSAMIDRLTTRNAVESRYRYSFLDSTLRGSIERRLNREPSVEATTYRIVSLGTSTFGLEKVAASGRIEVKDTQFPDETTSLTRTYNLNLSANPSKEYFTSASMTQIDDALDGSTNVTELNYKAEPMTEFRTDGKYTVSSIKEEFSSDELQVSKQTGSFKFDLRPIRELKLTHFYKPDFTLLARSGVLTYQNMTNQSEIAWSPIKEVSTGISYKVNNLMTIDKDDPELLRQDETKDTISTIYSIKYAPFRFLSTELNYFTEDYDSTDLVTAEPDSYLDGIGKTKRVDLIVKTPLSEQFAIDSRYSYERINQGTGEAASNLEDELTNTASIKTTWNIDESWSVFALGSYSQSIDYLSDNEPETYTLSPGLGFIYRLGDMLRIDGQYTYSRSHSGESTEKSNYQLQAKYYISQGISFTFKGQQENSIEPFYKATDLLVNLEINL